jgi:16S rRNA (guanine966-N2)-methyltransferase
MARQKSSSAQVRIIGGQWRGRKLSFSGGSDLRPTLGRTRETLFNWLRPHIAGTRCLDLFAGSGVLGFEALSQGADYAVLVDRNPATVQSLKKSIASLGISARCSVIKSDAAVYLQGVSEPFDIAFIDPPFDHPDLLERAFEHLIENNLVRQFIYLESRDWAVIERLASSLSLTNYRHTRSGDAHAALLEVAI